MLNNSHTVLIPKCKNPITPKDFRPIRRCNMVMKVITKAIANRIKHFLPEITDKEHSAFIKDRIITDNILVAMKCFQ